MPLEFETHDVIPEALRDDFTQLNGKGNWVPKDYVPKATHEEMKGRLEAQSGELGDLKRRAELWGEDDPAELRKQAGAAAEADKRLKKLRDDLKAANEAKAELEAKATGKDPKEVERLIAEAKEALTAELAEQHAAALKAKADEAEALSTRLTAATDRLDVLEVDTAIALEAAGHDDFVTENLTDAQSWGHRIFRRDDKGKLTPYLTRDLATNGDESKVGKPWYIGDRLATPKDLFAALRERRKSWFKAPASGGGAGGEGGKHPDAGKKTWTRAEYDAADPALRHKRMTEGYRVVEA